MATMLRDRRGCMRAPLASRRHRRKPRPPQTMPMFLQGQYATLKRNLTGAAEKMPAEHFSFRPTPRCAPTRSCSRTPSIRRSTSAPREGRDESGRREGPREERHRQGRCHADGEGCDLPIATTCLRA